MIVFEHLSSGGGSVISRETCLPPNSIYCFAYIYNVDFYTFLFSIWAFGLFEVFVLCFSQLQLIRYWKKGQKFMLSLQKEPPIYLLTTEIGPERPTGYGLLIHSWWRKVFTSLFFCVLINFLTIARDCKGCSLSLPVCLVTTINVISISMRQELSWVFKCQTFLYRPETSTINCTIV